MKEQQEKYDFPEGWRLVKLSDIAYINMGQSPPSDTYNYDNIGLPFFQGKTEFGELYPTISKYCSAPIKIAEKNDILISVRAPIGPTNLAPKVCCIGRGLASIKPFGNISHHYILWYLRSIEKSIVNLGTGSVFKAISKNILEEISIPIPPIQEIDRVILKLEELFSGLEKSKEQLELSFNKLIFHKKTFFKSLLERKKPSINFVEKRFEDCVVSYSNKRIPLSRSVRKERNGHYRYYGATGVIDYIDDYIFEGKYLLLGEDGANLLSKAKDLSFIVEGKFWVNNHAHIVQAKENIIVEYLNLYFNSLDITEYVTGTAQPKLNQANLNRIPILIPSPEEQISIVQEMQRVLSIIEQTENVITKELTRIDLFKQTILNKAFTGKLLEQDSNDEPASILLERIKAEKEDYLIREKEKKNNSIKIKAMPEKLKSILEILRESIEPVSSKNLWSSSDKKDDIEEFYAELKKHIESGDIIELPRNGKESFLKLADKS